MSIINTPWTRPTSEQCSNNDELTTPHPYVGTVRGVAAWYPQMGGYVGACIIEPLGGCVDVYVWHDGEFPFGDGDPTRLHHCDGNQFIEFGDTVIEAAKRIGRQ